MSNGQLRFRLFQLFFFISYFSVILCNSTNSTSSSETFVERRAQHRALTIIEQRGDTGRLVLLLCGKKRKCQKPRAEIPEWIRDFNVEHGYSGRELIHYYFYSMGSSLPIITEPITFPALVYIIAKTAHYYRGDLNDQTAVKSWLRDLDKVSITKPESFEEITNIFREVSGEDCSIKYLLLLNNEKKCPFSNWPILARQVASKHHIRPAHIYTPIATDTQVALNRRMQLLPKVLCRTLILLTQNSYSFLPDIVSTAEISEWLENHFPSNFSDCASLLETVWEPLRPPLTELELIFFSGEYELLTLEHKWSYIWIGIVGGCAVCTLAFSIFWGLNGTAFAR